MRSVAGACSPGMKMIISRNQSTTFCVLGRRLLLGGTLACAQPAWAAVTESDFLDDLPVVLSVSRLSQPVNEAPAAVTVIDQIGRAHV